jgi:hypothetical protein
MSERTIEQDSSLKSKELTWTNESIGSGLSQTMEHDESELRTNYWHYSGFVPGLHFIRN